MYEKNCATSAGEQTRQLVMELKRDGERRIRMLRDEIVRMTTAETFR